MCGCAGSGRCGEPGGRFSGFLRVGVMLGDLDPEWTQTAPRLGPVANRLLLSGAIGGRRRMQRQRTTTVGERRVAQRGFLPRDLDAAGAGIALALAGELAVEIGEQSNPTGDVESRAGPHLRHVARRSRALGSKERRR